MSHNEHTPDPHVAPDAGEMIADLRVCSLGRCDIQLVGTADVHTRLSEQVQSAYRLGASMILVDIDQLQAVTPSGIADLLHAVRFVRGRGADLRLYGHSPALTDALRALDLARLIAIYDDRDYAVDGRRPSHLEPGRPTTGRVSRRVRIGRRARFVGSN